MILRLTLSYNGLPIWIAWGPGMVLRADSDGGSKIWHLANSVEEVLHVREAPIEILKQITASEPPQPEGLEKRVEQVVANIKLLAGIFHSLEGKVAKLERPHEILLPRKPGSE